MHHEEQSFTLRFSLEATFPEDYEGEEDELAWAENWETRVKPDIIKGIFQTLKAYPDWAARFRNRGMASSEEIEIVLEKDFSEVSHD
ncbi:MAG: hypothetical protein AB7P17_14290 [Nitrospirales bacterium]|nr:hypothetical protein [Nitrospirales bacterium]